MVCRNCKKEIPEGSEFCPYCGKNLKNETEQVTEEKEMKGNICSSCKKEIPDGSEFCPYCGADLKEITAPFNRIDGKDNYIQDSKTVKQPTSKKTIIIIIVIIGIVIAVASYNVWNIYKKVNNKLNNFTDKLNISSENNADDTKKEKAEESKIDKDGVKALYKEKLEDKTWVKKNLYIKKDYVGNPIDDSVKQKVSYSIIDNDSLEIPVGIVITDYEEGEYCTQCTILTYENEEIKINSLDITRDCYTIDKDKNILTAGNARMGEEEITIYTINDKGVKKVGTLISEEIPNEDYGITLKYYFDDKEITEGKYNEIYNKYIDEDGFSELE